MKKIIEGMICAYQTCLRGIFPSHCCFVPTCSEYAKESVQNFGLPRATRLVLSRILRCHRFSKGGWDPIPEK